jgi:hypothetical protein
MRTGLHQMSKTILTNYQAYLQGRFVLDSLNTVMAPVQAAGGFDRSTGFSWLKGERTEMNIYGEPAPRYRIVFRQRKPCILEVKGVPVRGELLQKFDGPKTKGTNRQQPKLAPHPEALLVDRGLTL